MTMTEKELDALLAEARDETADVPADFMARMLDLAYTEQPEPPVPAPAPVAVSVTVSGAVPQARQGVFRGWLGSWPAGLLTAGLSGLWFGLAGPGVADVVGGLGLVEAGQTVEMFPGYDTAEVILSEG